MYKFLFKSQHFIFIYHQQKSLIHHRHDIFLFDFDWINENK